jgi:hypothetical protein
MRDQAARTTAAIRRTEGGVPAAVHRARRRQRQPARHHLGRRDQPVQPVRRHPVVGRGRHARQLFDGPAPLRRGRAARLHPGASTRCRPPLTLDGSFEVGEPQLLLGRQRRLRHQRRAPAVHRQRQRGESRPRARPRLRLHRRPACRSTSSAAPGRSPRRCSTMSPSTSATRARQRLVGLHRQSCRASCSTCRPARSASRSAIEHRDQYASYDPDRDHRRRPRRRRADQSGPPAGSTSTRSTASSASRILVGQSPSSKSSSSTARSATRTIRPSAATPPSPPRGCGSRPPTC